MANKSESTSPHTGIDSANETQPEDLNSQIGKEIAISDTYVEGMKPDEADIETFMDVAQQLEDELCSIVVGQERVIRELLLALLAGGHVLLEGVPGLGKTLAELGMTAEEAICAHPIYTRFDASRYCRHNHRH